MKYKVKIDELLTKKQIGLLERYGRLEAHAQLWKTHYYYHSRKPLGLCEKTVHEVDQVIKAIREFEEKQQIERGRDMIVPVPVYQGEDETLITYYHFSEKSKSSVLNSLNIQFPNHDWIAHCICYTEDSYVMRGTKKKRRTQISTEFASNISELKAIIDDLTNDLKRLEEFKLEININV